MLSICAWGTETICGVSLPKADILLDRTLSVVEMKFYFIFFQFFLQLNILSIETVILNLVIWSRPRLFILVIVIGKVILN